jgi:hypothetical protein
LIGKPPRMTPVLTSAEIEKRRKGVRRTVTILVSIVVAFFLLSFIQIVLMK